MKLALFRGAIDGPASASSLLLRVRDWLLEPAACKAVVLAGIAADAPAMTLAGPSARLLPFPIRGEALLVRLAELLRKRVALRSRDPNPFLLTLQRAARPRLLIDQASYIEFHRQRGAFHVVLEATSDTTVTLDTTDFDTLVQFVTQYIDGRLSEPSAWEAAS